MAAEPHAGTPAASKAEQAASVLRAAYARLEHVRPRYIVAGLVGFEWLLTLGLALTVRHNGWLYYQGGDQSWFYTTSWMLAHGKLPYAAVGYGYSVLLMPISLFAGPSLLHALPAIVLLNVLVLLPVAVLAMYGIGERIGGRMFGYWLALSWIAVPFIGIKFTDAGFHQRYTEAALPQGLGLTAMSDFPSMVMFAVAAYFLVRAVDRQTWTEGVLAGLFAGFGIGVKPSSALFLAGAGAALVAYRRWRPAVAFGAGLAPCIFALWEWKSRGRGYVPLLQGEHAYRLAAGAQGVIGLGRLHHYLHLSWAQWVTNYNAVQEHFWSRRLLEWLILAGAIGLMRRSVGAAALATGWLAAFVIAKGADMVGKIDDASLFRLLIPATPAFVLLLAATPLLLPGVPRRLRAQVATPTQTRRTARALRVLVVAATLVFAVVPVALASSAQRVGLVAPSIYDGEAGLVPATLPVQAKVLHGTTVLLTWPAQHVGPTRVFYTVLRALPSCLTTAAKASGNDYCLQDIARLRTPSWQESLSPGVYGYRIAVSANWLNRLNRGDQYLVSPWISVTIH